MREKLIRKRRLMRTTPKREVTSLVIRNLSGKKKVANMTDQVRIIMKTTM